MTAQCSYCALPISGRPRLIRIAGEEAPFCCWGCVVVFQVMGSRGERGQSSVPLLKLGLGLLFTMVVMVISWSRYLDELIGGAGGASEVETFLYGSYLVLSATAVMLILGYPIASAAWHGLRRRSIGLDALIALGIFAAYGLSLHSTFTGRGHVYYDTAVMLLVLVALGRYLESEAKARASSALRSLFDLTPRQATVIRHGREERLDVSSLSTGDVVKVRPGETFPVDGAVLEGEGSADQANLTGESAPAFKRRGDKVFAGTQNLDGAFQVLTEGVRDQTAVGRLARYLEQARRTKPPIVRIADRVAGAVIPLAVLLSLGAFAYWGWQEGLERGLMVALAVLLITCPCALGIATPLALWNGLGQAASRGILVRSGEALESLARVSHVFFDKTGTLTTGNLALSSIQVPGSPSEPQQDLVCIAGSLSSLSTHPVAEAIARFVAQAGGALRPVGEFRSYPGLGVRGRVEGQGRLAYLGSRLLMDRVGLRLDAEIPEEGEGKAVAGQGKTAAYLGWGGRVRALFAFREELRPEAQQAVRRLQGMGITVSVLTGDGQPAAEALQSQLSFPEVRWGLLPEDKVRLVGEAKRQGHRVAMVGDGVNDASALASADAGIALGCGTDIAREAAAASLLGSDLRQVPELIELARRTRRLVAGNFLWALLYNAIGIPLAAAGLLTPVFSALAMVLSSLFVVGNSLRGRAALPARSPGSVYQGLEGAGRGASWADGKGPAEREAEGALA